jgi:hypothetical protein
MTIGAKTGAAKGPRPAEARRQAGLRLERAGSGAPGNPGRGLSPHLRSAPQGRDDILLGPLHSHRADLQLRRGGPQEQPLEDGEPQGHGLGCRELLHQLLQRRPGEGGLQRGLSDGSRQLLQQRGLTGGGGVEAGVAERPGALLMLAAGDADQADAIPQVVLQGPGDAAAPNRAQGALRLCSGERSGPGPIGPPGSDPSAPPAGTGTGRRRKPGHQRAAGAPAQGHHGHAGQSG